MGLDLIELDYRIEKRFGVCVGIDAWERAGAGRIPFDLTAVEVTRLVTETLEREGISLAIEPENAPVSPAPPVLNYARDDVRKPIDNLWEEVRDIIDGHPPRTRGTGRTAMLAAARPGDGMLDRH